MVVLRMDIQDEILYGDCDLDRFKYAFFKGYFMVVLRIDIL